jgi:hypothetical protein
VVVADVLGSDVLMGLAVDFSEDLAVGMVVEIALSGVDGVQALTANKTELAAREIYFFMSNFKSTTFGWRIKLEARHLLYRALQMHCQKLIRN